MKKTFKSSGFSIEGLEELTDTLQNLLPREVMNISRSTVQGVASTFVSEMRKAAPKETGTLRKAIVAHRGRASYSQIHSDVLITKGNQAKNDAWYWHLVEWGSKGGQPAQPFVVPTIERLTPQISDIFRKKLGMNLERLVARKAKRRK